MNKIASTHELQTELRRLLAYAAAGRPSRTRIARELGQLGHRLTAADEKSDEDIEKYLRSTTKVKPDGTVFGGLHKLMESAAMNSSSSKERQKYHRYLTVAKKLWPHIEIDDLK
jgi:hypothetical protein